MEGTSVLAAGATIQTTDKNGLAYASVSTQKRFEIRSLLPTLFRLRWLQQSHSDATIY